MVQRYKKFFKEDKSIDTIVSERFNKFLNFSDWSDYRMFDVIKELKQDRNKNLSNLKKATLELSKTNYKDLFFAEQIKLQDKMISKYFKNITLFTHDILRGMIGEIVYQVLKINE
jgi:hypothetical protein